MSEGSLRICNLTLSTLAFHNLPHTNTIMTGMDAWLIAQCMARLPTLTYFSHPESSLEDFFSAEQTTILNGDSTSGQCGYVQSSSWNSEKGLNPPQHSRARASVPFISQA
jgi:hypothetical protein